MRYSRRRIACILSALLSIPAFASPTATPVAADPQTELEQVGSSGEVRLRKLHLVRPDLIPYPIAYEVYC